MSNPTVNLEKRFATEGEPERNIVRNYRLGKTLGEGTFGKVKIGIHVPTGEKVAVKILEKDRMTEAADLERVTREIHILQRIRHPNIIQLYDIIETPKKLFLVTEMATGGELFNYIVAKQRLPEREACRFFQQIISGVEYIHRVGIAHRDLKPENLLLDMNNQIKIIDFGLGNTYKEGELLKTACGSPCYAAPEMIAGKKYEGLMADIWSCGVILYAMLCGYLPFEDDNTNILYKKILKGVFELPDFLSRSSKDLLLKILNTNPRTRYTIEDIRLHPWFSIAPYRAEDQNEGIMVGYDPIPVDSFVLSQLTQYNINPEYAKKALESNKHNNVTTTYYLLVKEFIIQGRKGILEPNSSLTRHPKTFKAPTRRSERESKKLNESMRIEKRKSVKKASQSFFTDSATKEIESLNKSVRPIVQIKHFIDTCSTKPPHETEGNYYKKRSEFCHYKKSTQRTEEIPISLQRKIANNNRRNISYRDRRTAAGSHHNKTAIHYDEDLDKTQVAERDLSFDVFSATTNAQRTGKGYPSTLPLNDYDLTGPIFKKPVRIGPIPFKPMDRQRISTSPGKRVPYYSTSPHNNAKAEADSRSKSQSSKKSTEDGSKKTEQEKLNQSCVEKKRDANEGPITIIQTPQINNINNYNNISINTIAIGQPVPPPVPAPHPPPPPAVGSKVNQFRMRKYRMANNDNSPEEAKAK